MPKRAKAPRTGTRGEAGARYLELKAKWQARRLDPNLAGGGDWLVDKPDLPLDAAPFLRTLRTLGYVTKDHRFATLHSWIIRRSGLVDLATGHWSRYGGTARHPLTREVCEVIEGLIASGTSERLAIAEAAAEFAVRGNSFEAACKSVKRMLDEARKLTRQKRA
jgi:hypothetical protein